MGRRPVPLGATLSLVPTIEIRSIFSRTLLQMDLLDFLFPAKLTYFSVVHRSYYLHKTYKDLFAEWAEQKLYRVTTEGVQWILSYSTALLWPHHWPPTPSDLIAQASSITSNGQWVEGDLEALHFDGMPNHKVLYQMVGFPVCYTHTHPHDHDHARPIGLGSTAEPSYELCIRFPRHNCIIVLLFP